MPLLNQQAGEDKQRVFQPAVVIGLKQEKAKCKRGG